MNEIKIIKDFFLYVLDEDATARDINDFVIEVQKDGGCPFFVAFANEDGKFSADNVLTSNNLSCANTLCFTSIGNIMTCSLIGLIERRKAELIIGKRYKVKDIEDDWDD